MHREMVLPVKMQQVKIQQLKTQQVMSCV